MSDTCESGNEQCPRCESNHVSADDLSFICRDCGEDWPIRIETDGGTDRSPRHFRVAVVSSEFERMKQSQFVTVHDWHGLGGMSEWDYFVSISLPTTAVKNTDNEQGADQ